MGKTFDGIVLYVSEKNQEDFCGGTVLTIQTSSNIFRNLFYMWEASELLERHIENVVKHLRWSFFAETVKGVMLLTIFAKGSIPDI